MTITERPCLSAQALSFSYTRSSECVIEAFTHDFLPGSLTLLTGESGRGKSTLLYLLAGMLRPLRGEVRHGEVIVSSGSDAIRSAWRAQSAGFVFQDAVLDPSRSVLDNVVEPSVYAGRQRRVAETIARDLLERFGVTLRAQAPPAQISGGQAQRGRNLAGHQPLRALLDQQAKDIEPNARGQRFKDGGGGFFVHTAIIQQ